MGFPTGRPGGRGRGGACTATGARPTDPAQGQVQAGARSAPGLRRELRHARGQGRLEAGGGVGPLAPCAPSTTPAGRCSEPSFSGSQPTLGCSLRRQALSGHKDWRALATPKATGISGAASGGEQLMQGAALSVAALLESSEPEAAALEEKNAAGQ